MARRRRTWKPSGGGGSAPTPTPVSVAFDLQSAIDACPTGGTVTIPAGVWTATQTVNLKSNITLQGQGDSSVIKLVGGDDWTRVLSGQGLTGLTLRDFKVDGNAASATITGTGEQRHGIFLNACSDSLVERVTTTQPMGDGIFLYGSCQRITVQDCTAIAGTTLNARVGINFQGASNSIIQRNIVSGYSVSYKAELDEGDPDSVNVQVLNNVGESIALNGKASGQCVGYVVRGNTMTGDQYMWLGWTRDCEIASNVFMGNVDIGFYCIFANTRLNIHDNDWRGTLTWAGVQFSNFGGIGANSDCRVADNRFAKAWTLASWGAPMDKATITGNHYLTGASKFRAPENVTTLIDSGNVGDL